MKSKLIIFIYSLIFTTMSFAVTHSSETFSQTNAAQMIQKDLSNFAKSWNEGDIHSIISHYEQSNATTLIWSQMSRGYDNVKAFLQKNYHSKNDMGTLTTSDVKIKSLSSKYALVTGNWLIKTKDNKEVGGPFSMLYENTNHGWKIVLDHGSHDVDDIS